MLGSCLFPNFKEDYFEIVFINDNICEGKDAAKPN